MSSHDWRRYDNPRNMLEVVQRLTHERPEFDRLLRLFACAAARTVKLYIPGGDDGPSRRAIAVAERFADGEVSAAELETARAAAEGRTAATVRGQPSAGWAAAYTAQPKAYVAAKQVVEEVLGLFPQDQHQTDLNARTLGHLLDDLFGPFVASPQSSPSDPPHEVKRVREFASDHAMRTAAEAIYRENDFRDMRVFGEKLRAAGCREPQYIDHCCAGRHARGCWMIDAARVS
jgi:hypothetical protein